MIINHINHLHNKFMERRNNLTQWLNFDNYSLILCTMCSVSGLGFPPETIFSAVPRKFSWEFCTPRKWILSTQAQTMRYFPQKKTSHINWAKFARNYYTKYFLLCSENLCSFVANIWNVTWILTFNITFLHEICAIFSTPFFVAEFASNSFRTLCIHRFARNSAQTSKLQYYSASLFWRETMIEINQKNKDVSFKFWSDKDLMRK